MGAGVYAGPPRCHATTRRENGMSVEFCQQLRPPMEIGVTWACPSCGAERTFVATATSAAGPAPEPVEPNGWARYTSADRDAPLPVLIDNSYVIPNRSLK